MHKFHDDKYEPYLFGDKLYGDDFKPHQIIDWYKDEEHGYYNIISSNKLENYDYHALDWQFGFRYLSKMKFKNCLAFGCAYGDELLPICSQIKQITAIEPDKKFWKNYINDTPCYYIEPQLFGNISFPENTFDLITSFGVLHHIPNVSYVLGEMFRVLQPGGRILIREPIYSMGDWRYPRNGLTARERGIPLKIFKRLISQSGFHIIKENLCCFLLILKLAELSRRKPYKFFFNRNPYNNNYFVFLDSLLSKMFSWNIRYHRQSFWKKLAPCALFILATK